MTPLRKLWWRTRVALRRQLYLIALGFQPGSVLRRRLLEWAFDLNGPTATAADLLRSWSGLPDAALDELAAACEAAPGGTR